MFAQSTPREQFSGFSALMTLVPVWDPSEKTQVLPRTGEFSCGSDASCDVLVLLNGVAAQHCRISCYCGTNLVIPLADNRVWVNDAMVVKPERLHAGDVLAIGPATFRVEFRNAVPSITGKPNADDVSTAKQSTSIGLSPTAMASASDEILNHIKELEERIAAAEASSASAQSSQPQALPAASEESAAVVRPTFVPSALLSTIEAAAAKNGTNVESAKALKAREARIQDLESELDRRSEMLQQQLALFKQRQKQFNEKVSATEAELAEATATAAEERARLLAEIQERAAAADANAQKKTEELGLQSQALQRKHRGVEEAHLAVIEEKKALEKAAEQLEADKAAHAASAAEMQSQLESQIAEVQATYAEVNRLAEDSQASQSRMLKREVEQKNFDEELRHRHDELEARSQQLHEMDRQLTARESQLKTSQTEQAAELQRQQEELQAGVAALDERSTQLDEQAASLETMAAELQERTQQSHETKLLVEQQLASLQADQATFAAEQQQHLAEYRANTERQQVAEAALREQSLILQSEREQFEALKQQHDADVAAQVAAKQASEEAARLQQEELQAEKTALAALQQQHAADVAAHAAHVQSADESYKQMLAQLNADRDAFVALQQQHASESAQAEEAARQQAQQLAAEQAELTERSNAIAALEAELQTRADGLRQSEDQVAEETRHLEELAAASQQELDAAKNTIAQLEASLAERDEAYSRLEETVASAESVQQIELRTKAIEKREAELTKRHAEVTKKFVEINSLQESLKKESEQLEIMKSERLVEEAEWNRNVADRNSALDSRFADVEKLAAELEQKQSALAATNAQEIAHEQSVAVQAAELQARTEQLENKERELQSWAAELDRRHEETASRVQQVKQLAAAALPKTVVPATGASATASLSVAESHQFAQDLEVARRETERLTKERDELAIAVKELKTAFESARDELMAARELQGSDNSNSDNLNSDNLNSDNLNSDNLNTGNVNEAGAAAAQLAEYQKLLAEREAEIETTKADLVAATEHGAAIEAKLLTLAERLEQEQAAAQEKLDAAAFADTEPYVVGDEMELMQQVEQLKAELASSAKGSNHSPEAFTQQVEAYEQTIKELQVQLEAAQAAADKAAAADGDGSPLLEIVAELKERLQQQDQQITELTNANADAGGSNSPEHSSDELRTLHRELDDRAVVLDTRENELLERKRALEQSEGEIETQRRQLLEARQQLELARAEIQVAMQAAPVPPDVDDFDYDSVGRSDSMQRHDSVLKRDGLSGNHSVSRSSGDSVPAVRSEIAELFGIKVGDAKKDDPVDKIESLLPAVDEYSQELSAAVSMSFGRADGVLLEAASVDETHEEEPVSDGDDFVASYMEQLLARNRDKAGGTLPQELTKGGSAPSAAKPASKPEPAKVPEKKPSVQKSFIDSYMAGEYDSGDGNSTKTQPPQAMDETGGMHAEPVKAAPRARIDLESLRSNMDSFRELSTRSVENALASHAKRQEKGGITARSTVFGALCLVTVALVGAAFMKVVPFGLPIWLLIAATAASGAELVYRMNLINRKVKGTKVSLTKGANQDGSVSVPGVRPAEVVRPSASLDLSPAPENHVAENATQSGASVAEPVGSKSKAEFPEVPEIIEPAKTVKPAEVEDEYFEL